MPIPQEERNTLFVEQAGKPVKREWYSSVSNNDRQTQPVNSIVQSSIENLKSKI
jgi:hypothetical protein